MISSQDVYRAYNRLRENVADGIVLAVTSEHSQGRIYNVGEAEALTEAEWVRQIGRAAGWDGRVVVVRKDWLPQHLKTDYDWTHHWITDSGRIRHELGYREIVGRDQAIRETVIWERADPPSEIDGSQFDYAAEDAVLGKVAQCGG